MKPQLYVDAQYASPYALSVYVALTEKKIPFDLKVVDLDAGENLRPEYRERSVTARVPMFVHDGFALSESTAITEYLEETYFPPRAPLVFPTKATERARARQVQAWLRSDFMPIRQERPTSVIFFARTDAPLSDAARSAADKLFAAADALVGPSGHLFDDWCIADTDLALMLNRLVLNGDGVPPRLADYARSQWQRPSVQGWVQLPRPR